MHDKSEMREVRLFDDYYTITKRIEIGKNSEVYECLCISSNIKYAVKKVHRHLLSTDDDIAVKTEVEILSIINHKNITTLIDFFDEKDAYYIVLEYLDGRDLFYRIKNKMHSDDARPYSECLAKEIIYNLLIVIKYIHDKGIIHRDLKPENILLINNDNDTEVKLCDFGFSVKGDMEYYD